MHYEGQHAAEDPADTAARLALVRELEKLREVIGLAYGHLWMVNRYQPERASHEARKILRDTMTHEQRGEFINRVIAAVP